MYTPKHFQFKDSTSIIDFIRRFNFGVMISISDGRPIATHLPFVIEASNEKLILTSHMARNNQQWKSFENQEVLVIFSEPHAYISPKHYDKKESVPTWNYLSVHAYGKIEIVDDKQEAIEVLETMIDLFEPEYQKQWNQLSEAYVDKMVKEIVAFRLEVAELQATEKLSQNKPAHTRIKVSNALQKSSNPTDRLLGEIMKKREL